MSPCLGCLVFRLVLAGDVERDERCTLNDTSNVQALRSPIYISPANIFGASIRRLSQASPRKYIRCKHLSPWKMDRAMNLSLPVVIIGTCT